MVCVFCINLHLSSSAFPDDVADSQVMAAALCLGVSTISFLDSVGCFAFTGAPGSPVSTAAAVWPLLLRDKAVSGVCPEPE